MRKHARLCVLTVLSVVAAGSAEAQRTLPLSSVHGKYPPPVVLDEGEEADEGYDDSLAAAIAETYASNPTLGAKRYDLRATDDGIGIALSQTRPTLQAQASGGYDLTLPGDITNAARSVSDRLNDPSIQKNDITSQLVLDQPLWTGGRVSSAVRAARAASLSGREALRGAEGDLLLDLIVAYTDVRRDIGTLAARRRNLAALTSTLGEVGARRDAGELTRTDIAQAEVQLHAAEVQLQSAEAQLQASRASFAAIVGREPRNLAPAPDLPGLPADLDAAFALAETSNPDLSEAIAAERESRARIAVARAEGSPQIALRATAGTTGPISPFDRRDQDVSFTGRATLTIPLVAGGRIRSQVAQAQNRNAADELRIEATRRQLVQGIVTAWNQWAASEQNVAAGEAQLRAARIFHEGTTAEYREGLRSTFDVLYAQNSMRDAEIGLLASRRDSYVARAALLRRMGLLEAGKLLASPMLYDPARYTRRAEHRDATPLSGLIRLLDRIGAPGTGRSKIDRLPTAPAQIAPTGRAVSAPEAVTTRVSAPPTTEAKHKRRLRRKSRKTVKS